MLLDVDGRVFTGNFIGFCYGLGCLGFHLSLFVCLAFSSSARYLCQDSAMRSMTEAATAMLSGLPTLVIRTISADDSSQMRLISLTMPSLKFRKTRTTRSPF